MPYVNGVYARPVRDEQLSSASAKWERREHGDKCKLGAHLPYRVRQSGHVEVRCKLCYKIRIISYEESGLKEVA